MFHHLHLIKPLYGICIKDARRIIVHFGNEGLRNMCTENEYGYKCYVCYHLCFVQDLKILTAHLVAHFPGENITQFQHCNSSHKVCKINKIPPMSRSNDHARLMDLLKLDLLTERNP